MIRTEFYRTREDGVNLYITSSDRDMMIRQEETGVLYDAAIDVEGAGYTYTETDTPIEDEVSDHEALQIIMGREGNEQS